LSPAEAIDVFEKRWGIVWRGYGQPKAELMIAQGESCYCEPARGDTYCQPNVGQCLVWVLTWQDSTRGVTKANRGLPMADREVPRDDAVSVATAIVDAATGDVLAIFEGIQRPS
jgi:hypothetical protein